MTSLKKALGVLAVTAAFVVGGVAAAADRDWQKYDGTVSIDSTNFALVIGGSTGGGQLKFQDKVHDFKISGLSAGVNVGVSKVEAAGFVYDLKDVAKFPGTYKAYSVGGALGAGAGEIYLKNENDVIMKLAATSKGLQLNVSAASGIKVTMK
jgi:hypothetical protein